jgi:hypothetical protein
MSMSRQDREDLARVAKMRAKVAKDSVGHREAELRADVEAQLSATYQWDEDVWADITRNAKQAVDEADQRVAQICRELGVPERFRPRLRVEWYKRGENAAAERRAELRKLAQARIEAAGRKAKTAIESRTAEVLTELIAGGLESPEARAFLESIPTPQQLMPPVTIAELEATKPTRGENQEEAERLRQMLGRD